MKINADWELISDELNVILRQRKMTEATDDKPSKEYWSTKGYYRTPKDALRGLVEADVLGTGMADLQTVCDRIDALEQMIEQLPDWDLRRAE